MLDDFQVDLPPARNMMVVRNEDVPGMIGRVGAAVGAAGVNIADMAVGQDHNGVSSLMVLATDQPVSEATVAELAAEPGIVTVTRLRS